MRVVSQRDQPDHNGSGKQREPDEQPHRRPGEEQQRHEDRRENHRGSEVAAGEDEHDDQTRDGHQRHEQVLPLAEHFSLAGQQVSAPEDECELGEFRGLDAEPAAEGEPVLVAVDLGADDRHERQQHHDDDQRG